MIIAILAFSFGAWAQSAVNIDRNPASDIIPAQVQKLNRGEDASSPQVAIDHYGQSKKKALSDEERKKIVAEALGLGNSTSNASTAPAKDKEDKH